MCVFSSLHQINDKTSQLVEFLNFGCNTGFNSLSCTKPILHAQSFAHVAHAFLNNVYIGKLLIQFKHLGKS